MSLTEIQILKDKIGMEVEYLETELSMRKRNFDTSDFIDGELHGKISAYKHILEEIKVIEKEGVL